MILSKHMGKSKIKYVFLGTLACLIALVVGLLFYFNSVVDRPLSSNKKTIEIEVKEGEGFSNIIEDLDNRNLLRSKLCTKLKVRMSYKNISLIPGEYEISTDVSLKNLIKYLQTEDLNKNTVSITVPEGYSIDNMAKLFEENKLFSKYEFINAVKEYPLPKYVVDNPNKKYNLEGFLYPDTYKFNKDSTPDEVIKIMNDEFNKVLNNITKDLGVTISDNDIETIIIKSSLIEKEVSEPSEKKLVSSVIENRLNKNMKLQFCSTVNYVIGHEGHEVLTYKDIEIDSPYNTYKYQGLPVGPICSPGEESIIAALEPEKTDYLYFVLSENNKTHYFSKTAEEHEAAKAKMNS